MLIDFTVENFRSIKEPVTLSAVAQRSRARKEPRVIPDDEITPTYQVEGWDFGLLPALGVFGANASGKSNVLLALSTLLDLMKGDLSFQLNDPIIDPFALGGSRQYLLPTKFAARFVVDQEVYSYCLWLDRYQIVRESLSLAPGSTRRQRLLYSRDWDKTTSSFNWKNGEYFTGPHIQLEESIGTKVPYYHLLTQLNVPRIDPLKRWLFAHVPGAGSASEREDTDRAVKACLESPDRLDKISAIVRLFDTGVLQFTLQKREHDPDAHLGFVVFARHKTSEDLVDFYIGMESSGTRRLFGLANYILSALESGSLLIIDELGSNTHPHITNELIKLFQNPRTNPKHAQLIFASHDNTLMSDHLLRRDQIWFTEKGLEGVTNLFPLSDFKPRNDLAMDRAYMDGRYGAVPVLAGEEELVSAIAR